MNLRLGVCLFVWSGVWTWKTLLHTQKDVCAKITISRVFKPVATEQKWIQLISIFFTKIIKWQNKKWAQFKKINASKIEVCIRKVSTIKMLSLIIRNLQVHSAAFWHTYLTLNKKKMLIFNGFLDNFCIIVMKKTYSVQIIFYQQSKLYHPWPEVITIIIITFFISDIVCLICLTFILKSL